MCLYIVEYHNYSNSKMLSCTETCLFKKRVQKFCETTQGNIRNTFV